MANKWLPIYRAAGGKVIFNPSAVEGYPKPTLTAFLKALGLEESVFRPDEGLRYHAKNCCNGKSAYLQKARPDEAPDIVNCSTFTQWVYGRIGIELPARAIQQYQAGEPILDTFALKVGDLLFKRGSKNYWDYDNPGRLIGHVGIVTDVDSKNGTVTHATQSGGGVVETTVDDFIKRTGYFTAACRIVSNLTEWVTLSISPQLRYKIKTSDDVKWLLLESLPGT